MTGYVIAGAALLLALAVVAYDRWRTACTMRRLDEMLNAAMNGTFSEKSFDESRLSALESRLARYLSASALSERNVREQKDQISALISDISHQTKTPVANLQLYAQLLAEQPLTPRGRTVPPPSLPRRKSSRPSSRLWSRPPVWRRGFWLSTPNSARLSRWWSVPLPSMPQRRRKRALP